jgi:hypothetical protein
MKSIKTSLIESLLFLSLHIASGELKIAGRRLCRSRLPFPVDGLVVQPEAVHLASHKGPVKLIESKEMLHIVRFRSLSVCFPQGLGRLIAPVIFKVHEEKGDISQGVTVSKPVIEFDTIDDIKAVEKADVFHVEVTVAVPDLALSDSLRE